MGLCPDKPIINWKYELKTHWIYLIYYNRSLAKPTLSVLRTLALLGQDTVVSGQAPAVAFLFFSPEARDTTGHFIEMMGFQWKCKTQHPNKRWRHSALQSIGFLASCWAPDWKLWLTTSAQHCEGVIPCFTSLGKEQNSELGLWFLLNVCCFCTIV